MKRPRGDPRGLVGVVVLADHAQRAGLAQGNDADDVDVAQDGRQRVAGQFTRCASTNAGKRMSSLMPWVS